MSEWIQGPFEILATSTAAVGPTTSLFSARQIKALFTIEGAGVRWRADGTAPTSAVGGPLGTGDSLSIEGKEALCNVKFISTSGASTASIPSQYFFKL